MKTQAKKLQLIEWLVRLDNSSLLNALDKFRLKFSSAPSTKKISFDELLNELEFSESDRKKGRVISFEELEKESDNW